MVEGWIKVGGGTVVAVGQTRSRVGSNVFLRQTILPLHPHQQGH
jgi:hypothetical protein